ncbi:MAG: hypothetical protein KI790_18700 [Cyclobacteriaceae bacterium]|nr:hypothetical protein [Cyclobacteriaceae bacterium HetDA_MAG_MS6]
MIVRRNLNPRLIFLYAWKSLLYFLLLAVGVYFLHSYELLELSLPIYTITILSTAIAIFLGFNNNQAYDRWWEARKIWGLMVNYSRAWARQVTTLFHQEQSQIGADWKELQRRMVYRHAAFVHALRVFLRAKHPYNRDRKEYIITKNAYEDLKHLIGKEEYAVVTSKDNPPNYLLQLQGRDLKYARDKGWINDFHFVELDQTLIEFNNIQGRSERIKNTPMPRPYSYFARIFVFIHATLLPFALVEGLDWAMIPVSFLVSFVFLSLDIIGERTQDPFENRMEDTPMTTLSWTIERNLKEQLDETDLPEKPAIQAGVLF